VENHGFKMKEAGAAISDAPLIESAAHPRIHVEAPTEDEAPDKPATLVFSSDHGAQ